MRRFCLILAALLLTSCRLGTPETIPETVPVRETVTSIDPAGLSEDTFSADSGEHEVRMLFVNAGKADCVILEADGKTYLIDTGEDSSVPQILAGLAYMGTTSIEAVFLTHTDKDHIGGWDAITRAYPVEKMVTASIMEAPRTYENMADGMLWETVEPGQSVAVGNDGLWLDVLCPITLYPEEENNNSLILRLDAGEETVLFAGDMKELEEADLLSTGFDLGCTVLKVPYHGRKDASGQAFLEACVPELAIICSDTETDPDTAHKKVLSRLRDVGAEVRRTEDTELGWLVTLEGKYRYISEARIAFGKEVDLQITDVSAEAQTVTIENRGETVDIGGYFLYSERGSEVFVFPAGTVLEAGESLTIGCVGTMADIIWEGETSVWHKTKEDPAVLYDRWGNVLDER